MVLYIGNILSKHGLNPTTIEILGDKLSQHVELLCVSDKKNRIYRLLDMLFAIFENRNQINCVIIDTYSKNAFLFCLFSSLLCRAFSIPYVPVMHSGDINSIHSFFLNTVLKNSYTIVVPSLYIKEKILQFENKIIQISNFIDLENYRFKIRSCPRPNILWVRSLQSRYAPQLAIEVIKELREVYPETKMSMVGPDKGEKSKIQKLIRNYELEDNITLVGKLPKSAWHNFSESFDLFLNTSQIDNQPISLMEAMALGMPIVSSKVGDIPNMIDSGKEGLLVDPPKVIAYVEAIVFLISNPSVTESISVRARRKAERYDWKKVKPLWKELLDEYL